MSGNCELCLIGHEEEVSKVSFNPQGTRILTASGDGTACLFNTQDGKCEQILDSHSDEIFSCAFNYDGDAIITASKVNVVKIFRC